MRLIQSRLVLSSGWRGGAERNEEMSFDRQFNTVAAWNVVLKLVFYVILAIGLWVVYTLGMAIIDKF